MLFGRRKPGYTTTVDGSADPEQAVLELQKAELAAKKKPKAEVFDIDAASETARRLKETGSTFDGSAAKAGEDVMAVVERETRGIPEAMRFASLQITPRACLSRGAAGILGRTLIVNLPGNGKAARENLAAVIDPIRHGVEMLLSSGSTPGENPLP